MTPATSATARLACPSCGIAVTPGYPRCPKCHAALPSSGRMNRLGDTAGGGGTVAADEPARRWPWYLAGLIVLGGAVAVVVIGSNRHATTAELPDDPVTGEEVVEPESGSAPADEGAPEVPARTPDPAPAADRLAKEMARVRLFATVEPIVDTIEIRTAACEDDRIPGLIAEVAPDLRAAGITSATCRSPAGVEAWTRPLP